MILLITELKQKIATKPTKKKYKKDYKSFIDIFQKTKNYKRKLC